MKPDGAAVQVTPETDAGDGGEAEQPLSKNQLKKRAKYARYARFPPTPPSHLCDHCAQRRPRDQDAAKLSLHAQSGVLSRLR